MFKAKILQAWEGFRSYVNVFAPYFPQILTWGVTFTLLLGFLSCILNVPSVERIDRLGDLLGGFAGSLAFVWLIAGFYQQAKELKLQRQELSLQRTTLEQQKAEFHELNKHQNLTHIKNILDKAEDKIGDLSNLSADVMLKAFMNEKLKPIMESRDIRTASDAATEYMKGIRPLREFLAEYKAALILALENGGVSYTQHSKSHLITFIYIYNQFAEKVPYLSRYYATIQGSLHFLISINIEMIEEAMQLIVLVFGQETVGEGILKKDAVEKSFKDFVEKYGEKSLPQSCRSTYASLKQSSESEEHGK